MSESVFVHLTSLAGQVHAPHGSLQTQPFLDVCAQVIPVLGGPLCTICPSASSSRVLSSFLGADKFGASFIMVRSDIGGNINRLAQKLAADPARFASLFAIVLDDIEKGDTGGTSCTKGLLWLKRLVLARQASQFSSFLRGMFSRGLAGPKVVVTRSKMLGRPARKEALPSATAAQM